MIALIAAKGNAVEINTHHYHHLHLPAESYGKILPLIPSIALASQVLDRVTPAVLEWYRADIYREAQAIIVDCLAGVLAGIKNKKAWPKMHDRNSLVTLCETAAVTLERGIVPRAIPGDRETAEWWRHESREMARGVRGMKRSILAPKADTREFLERRLTTMLLAAAAGNWDCFVGDQTPHLRESVAVRSLRAFRTVVAGSSPLLVTYALARTHKVEGSFLTSLFLFTGTLAAISILVQIDPRLATRLSDTSTVLGGLGRGK